MFGFGDPEKRCEDFYPLHSINTTNLRLLEIRRALVPALRILRRHGVYTSLNAVFNIEKSSPAISANSDAGTLKMLVGYGEVSILIQTIVLLSVSSKCHVPEAMPELLITNS